MKSIILKTVDVEMNGKPMRLSYQAQLIELMKAPLGQGADIEEIRRSIRVLDALDKVENNTLNLEDSDFEFMKTKVLKSRWPIIDKYVIAFVDDVTQ